MTAAKKRMEWKEVVYVGRNQPIYGPANDHRELLSQKQKTQECQCLVLSVVRESYILRYLAVCEHRQDTITLAHTLSFSLSFTHTFLCLHPRPCRLSARKRMRGQITRSFISQNTQRCSSHATPHLYFFIRNHKLKKNNTRNAISCWVIVKICIL